MGGAPNGIPFRVWTCNNNHVCHFHPDSPAASSQVHPDVIWNALEVEKQNTDCASVELPLPCKVQLRITYFQASCIGEDHKFTVFRGVEIPVHIRMCFCSRIWLMIREASCISPKNPLFPGLRVVPADTHHGIQQQLWSDIKLQCDEVMPYRL